MRVVVVVVGAVADAEDVPVRMADVHLAHAPRLEQHLFPTDHALADHRVALARTVTAFLERWLKA